MKYLITTIAAVLLVACGESQQSAPALKSKTEPPTYKAPEISIHKAAEDRKIETVKQHLAVGTDVNAKNDIGETTLHFATYQDQKESPELLIANGADVNAKDKNGHTPLDWAKRHPETAALLRKHGAKTG